MLQRCPILRTGPCAGWRSAPGDTPQRRRQAASSQDEWTAFVGVSFRETRCAQCLFDSYWADIMENEELSS
ncbi:hypothetical protein SKAU_G00237920 [Synaphobranchus kaupii]|uniref:Uncharacterized protein n=1 Tax=Synaphobranchus kaupii TaxID=118154 RepID=A0A9Q1IU10_SYNKA|nr:hypothetical protein SKAU_G00237920 [Synaphobranchus kaupii]